jgi:hypothetical protein
MVASFSFSWIYKAQQPLKDFQCFPNIKNALLVSRGGEHKEPDQGHANCGETVLTAFGVPNVDEAALEVHLLPFELKGLPWYQKFSSKPKSPPAIAAIYT